jgi:NADPH-dependent 2,4-dienoyl-CoA reductase/sulfur reductase-like enzyme
MISMIPKVVVIGAGVYGAAVTASLTRRGASVVVVDAGVPAGGASGSTFSWTNSSTKHPRTYHDLGVAGMEAHRYEARWLSRAEVLQLEPDIAPGNFPRTGSPTFRARGGSSRPA